MRLSLKIKLLTFLDSTYNFFRNTSEKIIISAINITSRLEINLNKHDYRKQILLNADDIKTKKL